MYTNTKFIKCNLEVKFDFLTFVFTKLKKLTKRKKNGKFIYLFIMEK